MPQNGHPRRRPSPAVRRIRGNGAPAAPNARAYDRDRDLPRLIPLWPEQIGDRSRAGTLVVLQMLRRALRAERNRARANHWTYDLNRHLGLLAAYRAECAQAGATSAHSAPDVDVAHRRPRCTRPSSGATLS